MTEEVPYGQYNVPPVSQMVNLKVGQPAPSMLPLDDIRKAANAKFAEDDPNFLQYGNIYGFPKFRQSLCKFLTERYGHKVDDDKIMASNGVTGALALICSLFTKTGDIVYTEEPTYFLAKSIFQDFKLNVVQNPMDSNGLDVDALEKRLEDPNSPKPVMMYVVTTAHNPTGRTLPADRRKKLAELSAKHNFYLICDEVYQLLTFPSITPPPAMFTYNTHGNIIAVGSFSKILAPSLRVGWIQATPAILKKIASCGQLDSSGGMNPISFGIVQRAIDMGIQDKQLDWTRKTLEERYHSLRDAMKKYLPEGITFEVPQGGYFVLVALPKGKKAADLLPIAEKHKVFFLPGSSFGESMQNYLRLSFSYYNASDITIGVERLGAAITEFLGDESPRKKAKN